MPKQRPARRPALSIFHAPRRTARPIITIRAPPPAPGNLIPTSAMIQHLRENAEERKRVESEKEEDEE